MKTAIKIFRRGRNQVIRIPVEMGFDADTVILEKQGSTLTIRPRRHGSWAEFFADEGSRLPDEFELPADPPAFVPKSG